MPPKNKKDAEEEAKRLQQQRKKKQEQQARLQLQRKKYLSQTLSTGLLLPASNQLIIDFSHKSLNQISQKLKQAIKDHYPQILKSHRLQFVLKQLHYFIKDSFKIFGQAKQGINLSKHRIFVGIMLNILLNNDVQGNGRGKNRAQDQRKAKQLVTKHCNKIQGFDHLNKNDGFAILNYLKQTYFSKFLLLKLFDKFPKRHSQSKFSIFIETPNVYRNEESTPFTDLSKAEEEKHKQQGNK